MMDSVWYTASLLRIPYIKWIKYSQRHCCGSWSQCPGLSDTCQCVKLNSWT